MPDPVFKSDNPIKTVKIKFNFSSNPFPEVPGLYLSVRSREYESLIPSYKIRNNKSFINIFFGRKNAASMGYSPDCNRKQNLCAS